MASAIGVTQAFKWSLVKIKHNSNKLGVVGTCVTISSSPNTIINSHGEIPAEMKPRAIPHYLGAIVTFNSPIQAPQILFKPSLFITKLQQAHIFFRTIVSRNQFWKTNPTNIVFRDWQAHNSALPREHKITINNVQLAFSASYAGTKLLFKYYTAIAA